MKEYKFNSQLVEMNIAGNIFKVDISEKEFMKKLTEIKNEATLQSDTTGKKIDEDGDLLNVYEESNNFFRNAIDTLLGEGATDLIFKDRTPNPFDMLDILSFISDSITEETKSKTSTSYSNRAMRRSEKKSNK